MTEETERDDALIDAVTAVVPPILNAMEVLGFIGRHLHPPHLPQLIEAAGEKDAPVREQLEPFRNAPWPERLVPFKEQIEAAAEEVCKAYDGLRAAGEDMNGVYQAYRSLRHNTRAFEALYPVAPMLLPVSRFFLEQAARDDMDLLKKLDEADASRDNVGVMHANNEKGSRGGFSIYVPEYYDEATACPLVMALHGGSGHGRDFLWTWIREARTRGAILISPSSRGDTWSLMGPDIDSELIDTIVGRVRERWNVDPERLLLTGMSDGGTFAYVTGLRKESPFTHLAPISASFHPMLIEAMDAERIKGLPIYLTHGALDWMFPVDIARAAKEALTNAGAEVVYREIADLSHTYPRDENPRIMDWLTGAA